MELVKLLGILNESKDTRDPLELLAKTARLEVGGRVTACGGVIVALFSLLSLARRF